MGSMQCPGTDGTGWPPIVKGNQIIMAIMTAALDLTFPLSAYQTQCRHHQRPALQTPVPVRDVCMRERERERKRERKRERERERERDGQKLEDVYTQLSHKHTLSTQYIL